MKKKKVDLTVTCDRCRASHSGEIATWSELEIRTPKYHGRFGGWQSYTADIDLCEECTRGFNKWLGVA